MTEQEIPQVTENVSKLTDGTLLQMIITYTKACLNCSQLDPDNLEIKDILCQEARSRGLLG